ncbi:MAG: hypothetical protein K940chlam2_00401 [Chlamydiae bacterium]|nr:hypothetical protein [Chlamydiota bacterium]
MASNANFIPDTVNSLMSEYSGGVMLGRISLEVAARDTLKNNGFMGSYNVVFLTSRDSIEHEAPGCIAAPLVNMFAKDKLSLGVAGQGSQPVPVRIFAPAQLTLTSQHLSVGDIKFLEEPKSGFLSCKKLTLIKPTEDEPVYFDLIKSWVIDDETQIEILKR